MHQEGQECSSGYVPCSFSSSKPSRRKPPDTMQACAKRAKASWEPQRSDDVSCGSCVDNASAIDCRMADGRDQSADMAASD